MCFSLNCSSLLCAQFEASGIDTIDFILSAENNILIHAVLNGSDSLLMMVHTDIHSISLNEDSSERLLGSKGAKSTEASSWSGAKEVDYVDSNAVSVAGIERTDLRIWLDLLTGKGADGKLGLNFFGDSSIIRLDFDQSELIIYDDLSLIRDLSSFRKLQLSTNEQQSLYVHADICTDGQVIKHKFLIHSGYGGTIILDDHFYRSHPFLQEQNILARNDLKDSFGRIIKTKKIEISEVRISDYSFSDVPVSVFESEMEIQKVSVMGGDFLRRFDVIIDRRNLHLYVRANAFTLLGFKDQ